MIVLVLSDERLAKETRWRLCGQRWRVLHGASSFGARGDLRAHKRRFAGNTRLVLPLITSRSSVDSFLRLHTGANDVFVSCAARWGMESSLDTKQVDELLGKYRAMTEREQRRVDELAEQNENALQEICSSLLVPGAAFGMSYARGYFGEKASVWGIPIDACVGLFLQGLAACLGLGENKGAQRLGKFFRDIANGSLASWAAALGANYGSKKRLEKPAPASIPQIGAEKRASGPMTLEQLVTMTGATLSKPTGPSQWQPVSGQSPAPSAPMTYADAAKVLASQSPTPQHSPLKIAPSATAEADKMSAPLSSSPKPYRFTQRWAVNPEAEMRFLLQSVGAPSDPNTVALVLSHEHPGDEFKAILRRARAPT